MLRFAAVIACGLVMAGCATAVRGTTETVIFDSTPAGAEMRSIVDYPCGGPCPVRDDRASVGAAYLETGAQTPVENGPACLTPCSAEVKRNQALIVTFAKPGYEPQTVKLGIRVADGGAAGVVVGNALAGGITGMIVDTGTGAAMDHYPNPLKVTLVPIRQPVPLKPKR
jgi:hypothetical protein